MKRAGTAALMVTVLMIVLAGCSSSTPAVTPLPYQHSGPDTVGVTTLDLGSAGPVFGERLALSLIHI